MHPRRRVLAAAATALAAGVAGCATGDEEPDGNATSVTATTLETDTEATTTTTEQTTTEQTTTEQTTTQEATTEEATTERATNSESTDTPATETVTVGPSGELRFDPSSLTVPVGTTVEFRWDSGGHNVVVTDQPANGSWSGTSGGVGTTYDTGHTHAHTFDVAGRYEYHCAPHRSLGMTGTVVVE